MRFGRLERRTPARPMSDINMTPLIDVMLVLLVIFLVSAPLLTGRLGLRLPQADAPAAATPPGALQLRLDAAGTLRIGEETVAPALLGARLRAVAARDPATEVHLQADREVAYGEVARLIADLQAAGLSRIAFITQARP